MGIVSLKRVARKSILEKNVNILIAAKKHVLDQNCNNGENSEYLHEDKEKFKEEH